MKKKSIYFTNKFLRHLNLFIQRFRYKQTRHDTIFPFARDGSSTTNRFNLLVNQYCVYFRPMVGAGEGAIAISSARYTHVEGLVVALSNVFSH